MISVPLKAFQFSIPGLSSLDPGEQDFCWSELVQNPLRVLEIRPDDIPRLLNAGLTWQSSAILKTSLLCKLLYKNLGSTMVSNDFKRYRDVFLFGIALYFEPEFGDVSLDDTQTNLALKFYNLLSTGNAPPQGRSHPGR